jgi:hypothetical protein
MSQRRRVSRTSRQQHGASEHHRRWDALYSEAVKLLSDNISQAKREQVTENFVKIGLENEVLIPGAEVELLEDEMDFGAVLALAEPLLTLAQRLAEWAQDGQLDDTGADMLLRIGEQWLALESILHAHGLGTGNARWSSDDDRVRSAASCLHDLACAIRKNAEWLKYLPDIITTCLLNLAPDACMGMPHAVFAKRLAVAVELLRAIQRPATPKGKPGRRGYPLKALNYAKELRKKNPMMKIHVIRQMCLKKFSDR